MNIYEKLLNIQLELKAPKSQYNGFGKYSYRSCEDILEALKPCLKQFNLTVILTDNLVEVNGRNYVQATVTLIDIDDPKQQIVNTAFAREEETKKGMDGSQITGASSSYARKYALNGLFAIDDNKDSDSTNKGEEKKTKDKVEAKPVSKKQLAINCILKLDKFVELDNIMAALQKTKLEDCTEEELTTIYNKVNLSHLKLLCNF